MTQKQKSNQFELKISMLLLLVIVLVSVTGFVAYKRFSQIVNQLTDASRPDLRLITAQSLLNQLSDVENSAKTYNLTNDTIYLNQFFHSTEGIEEKVATLKMLNIDKKHELDVNKIDSLINEKILVLSDLLIIQDEFRVERVLNKIVSKINVNEQEKTNLGEPEVLMEDQSKKNFFNWFKPKREKSDSLAKEAQKTKHSQNLNNEIKKVKTEEMDIENQLRVKELALIVSNQELSRKLSDLIEDFKAQEKAELIQISNDAKKQAKSTNRQIALFCISVGILLFFVAYLITRYVKSNNRYKQAMKTAQLEAEQIAISRQQFLANMSHEIRTPMNAISGFASLLKKSDLTPEQSEQLEMILKSSEHLIYLINDVLDFSKLQSGKLKLEKINFSPHQIVTDVVEFTKQLAADKDILISSEIEKKSPKNLLGDPFRFRQILLNLMSNAAKFTEIGSVKLVLSSKKISKEKILLTISIEDTGIGMNEETRARIFNEFEQADVSTSRNFGGTGLGLPITRKLVEMHDGTINLTSESGVGTSIMIEMPYAIATETVTASPKINVDFLKNLNILIIDDALFNRKLLSTILTNYGANIYEADNGKVALDTLENNDIDLVLTDIRMPVMDGIEATKHIRKLTNSDKSNVKIIVLTAAVNDADIEQYKAIGANGFIPKPFNEEDLLREIQRVFFPSEKPTSAPKTTNEVLTNGAVDFSYLKKVSGSDNDFYTEMLDTFIKTTLSGLELIKVAHQNDDYQMVCNQAHKISSPCKHIGANNLYNLLKQIEKITRDATDLKSLPKLIQELTIEVDLVISETKEELSNY